MIILLTLITISIGNIWILIGENRCWSLLGSLPSKNLYLSQTTGQDLVGALMKGINSGQKMSDTFWSAPLWWHLPTCSLVMFFFGRDSITCGRAGGVPSFAISGWALKNCKEKKYLLKTMFNRHPYFKLGTEEKKEASEKIRVINCLFHDFLLASKHQGSVIFKRGLT